METYTVKTVRCLNCKEFTNDFKVNKGVAVNSTENICPHCGVGGFLFASNLEEMKEKTAEKTAE